MDLVSLDAWCRLKDAIIAAKKVLVKDCQEKGLQISFPATCASEQPLLPLKTKMYWTILKWRCFRFSL